MLVVAVPVMLAIEATERKDIYSYALLRWF